MDDEAMTKVLLVDDEKSIRVTLGRFLAEDGYETETAASAQDALDLIGRRSFDVVVTDIILPQMTGVALLQEIRRNDPHVQVILMTGEPTVETATHAVRAGAADYLLKPITREAILRAVNHCARLKRVEDERRRLEQEQERHRENLEKLVEERTVELSAANQRLRRAMEDAVRVMAKTVESRDPYTAGHQQRVADLARAMAAGLGETAERLTSTFFAGLIHDVGKIAVPAEILSKPSALSAEEFALIKAHPETGYTILSEIAFPWPIADVVRQHHERMDGSGYPKGLSGDAIIFEARILAVADVVEAMSAHRPYRPGLGIDCALEEIQSGRGTRYDASAADTCTRLFREEGFTFPAASVLQT